MFFFILGFKREILREYLRLLKALKRKGGCLSVAGSEKLRKTNPRLYYGLTHRQAKFAEYVIQGLTATKAYLKAGYSPGSMNVTRSLASRMLVNEKIRAYIEDARREMIEELVLDRATIQRRLLEIGQGRIKEEVVTSAVVGRDETGRKIYEPVVVEKKAAIRDQVTALSYLDKVVKEVEDEEKQVNIKQEMEDDPITKSIMEQFSCGGNNGL